MNSKPFLLGICFALVICPLADAQPALTNFGGLYIQRGQTFSSGSSRLSGELSLPSGAATTNATAACRAASGESGPFLSTLSSGGERFSRASSMLVESPNLLSISNLLNINFTCEGSLKTGFAAIGQTTNDVWNQYIFPEYDEAEMDSLVWADGSNASGVTLSVLNAPGQWFNGMADPMYNTFIYPWDYGDISVSVSGLPTGTYTVFVYGHTDVDDGNGIFELFGDSASYGQRGTTSVGAGWASTNWWEEGQQYVVFRNVTVTNGTIFLDVIPNAAGYAIISGIQIAPSASVIDPPVVAEKLLNLNLTDGGQMRVGIAAYGQNSTDTWNNVSQDSSGYIVRTNLLWANGTASGVTMTAANGPGVWYNGADDHMYGTYFYTYGDNITIGFDGLPSRNFDVVVYGHGPEDGNSVFQLSCGTNTYEVKGTTQWGTAFYTTNWEEGIQYVVYRDVPVASNDTLTITVLPGVPGYTIVNGVQLILPLDRDGNGLPDSWEILYFGHTGNDPNADPDGDGLTNLQEFQHGTNPTATDSDGDGVSDFIEVLQGRNPSIAGSIADTNNFIKLQVYTPLH
jgi:hypothetical protein